MPVARRMHLCYFIGLLVSLAPLLVVAQSMSVPHESVRREQVQEVERYMERVEGEDRSVKYVVYVVLPALGLIGCLMVLRRFYSIEKSRQMPARWCGRRWLRMADFQISLAAAAAHFWRLIQEGCDRLRRPSVGVMGMVNGWDAVRRRSCGGEKGKTLRSGWDREVGELGGVAGCRASYPQKQFPSSLSVTSRLLGYSFGE